MITASIVLYNTSHQDLLSVVSSFKPSSSQLLFLIDNSPLPLNLPTEIENNKYITYIYTSKNIGYGAGHNIAIKEAFKLNSTYHIVLNPDVYFESEVIIHITDYMNKNLDTVYLLPKVTYPNGELQYLCKLLPTPFDLIVRRFLLHLKLFNNHNDKYVLKNSGYDKIMNPPCLSGCFMFLRISTLKENNIFFDDSFFMYFEDFDLIRRLHKIGKTIYYPNVSIIHNHAKESYKSKKMLIAHVKSGIKYFNKHGWIFDKDRRKFNKQILKEIELLNKK